MIKMTIWRVWRRFFGTWQAAFIGGEWLSTDAAIFVTVSTLTLEVVFNSGNYYCDKRINLPEFVPIKPNIVITYGSLLYAFIYVVLSLVFQGTRVRVDRNVLNVFSIDFLCDITGSVSVPVIVTSTMCIVTSVFSVCALYNRARYFDTEDFLFNRTAGGIWITWFLPIIFVIKRIFFRFLPEGDANIIVIFFHAYMVVALGTMAYICSLPYTVLPDKNLDRSPEQ